jgi:hypothetical protein
MSNTIVKTLTERELIIAKHEYWQLFSLLSAMISLLKDEDDDLIEVKTLLGMALEKVSDFYSMFEPAPEVNHE